MDISELSGLERVQGGASIFSLCDPIEEDTLNLQERQLEMLNRTFKKAHKKHKNHKRTAVVKFSPERWGDAAVPNPHYARRSGEPFLFADDDSVIVEHYGALPNNIILHTVPFNEMVEFVVPSGIPANQRLAIQKQNIKAEDKKIGVQRTYTAQEALSSKEAANKCAICHTVFKDYEEKHGDHDHKTGKWRGVLCTTCNSGIGMLKDNPELCEAAATYLRNSKL